MDREVRIVGEVLGIIGPYKNYAVFSGTAGNDESEFYDLPDGVKRIDVMVINNPLLIRFLLPGKGGSQQIAIPANTIYTVYISPDRFSVQNYTQNQNAIYSVVAWM